VSRAKAKGTRFETQVVEYLRTHGFSTVERRSLAGANDKGDITGLPGVVIEVKNHKAMTLAGWVDEAEAEGGNAGADLAVVWHKRRGKGSPGDCFVTMSGDYFVALLRLWSGQPDG
jgi:voltage-gated potassium channel Kch